MEREEAINIVRKNIPHLGLGATEMTEALESLIPELRESEDERIRKQLIAIMNFLGRDNAIFSEGQITKEQAIDYLERQKEPEKIQRTGVCCFTDVITAIRAVYNEESADELIEYLTRLVQKEQKPIQFKNDELVEIIKGEFEGFRRLLKKKGIDYEPQRGYWEGFARLFDSSAMEYVKEQKPLDEAQERKVLEKHITEDMISSDANARLIKCGWHVSDKKPAECYDAYKTCVSSIHEMCNSYESNGTFNDKRAVDFLNGVRVKCLDAMMYENVFGEEVIPPAEWSEEDKQCLDTAIAILENLGYDGVADNLKHLRPHPQWKPSEKQMDGLKHFVDWHRQQYLTASTPWPAYEALQSLQTDLLKLKQQ